ncbi:hypothetical protein ABEY41_03040 [Peribacillus butanolivorans]|uniref:hypothetical protein n=1 Tax=Peribacillus butanolivorans TaxID=421767 RepID=UPI003D2C1690
MNETIHKKRADLIGKTGEITKDIEIIDADEREHGISVRVRESSGEVYWTTLDADINLFD